MQSSWTVSGLLKSSCRVDSFPIHGHHRGKPKYGVGVIRKGEFTRTIQISFLALCTQGWVTYSGARKAKKEGSDLRVRIRIIRVSGRGPEIGHSKEEVIGRFLGGWGEGEGEGEEDDGRGIDELRMGNGPRRECYRGTRGGVDQQTRWSGQSRAKAEIGRVWAAKAGGYV